MSQRHSLAAWNRGLRPPRSWIRRLVFALVLLTIFAPFSITSGGEKSSLWVANKTDYYLHVIVDGHSYLYVAPGREIVHSGDPSVGMLARVFYSPGQELQGSITRTLSVPHKPAETGCAWSLENGPSCSLSPQHLGAVRWQITADTMLVNPDE